MNEEFNEKLELAIKEVSEQPSFKHHTWYYSYHLKFVEQICEEICDKYPQANRDLVRSLVWMHDYGKMIDFDNEYTATQEKGKQFLLSLGFEEDYAQKIIDYLDLMDKREELGADHTPLEVKIIASADGAAHLIGPFFHIYWHEHPQKTIEELMQDGLKKGKKDWEKKIVLPEVKEAFERRHSFLKEQMGDLPEKFL